MKTEIVDVSPTRKELKIEIDAAEVRAEYDRISDRYAKQAAVPGFRKGHAPRSVVRTRFKNEIRSEVVQQLVPQAIHDAITENDLDVIGEPDIHLDNNEGLEKLGDQPLTLHAHVEVMPEVVLGQYKGLEAVRRVRPVTDEHIEELVEHLRESSASLQPVEERGAELGDTVTIDIQGRYIDPPEDEDINVEDVDVVLGGDGIVPEFNEHLAGTREGEAKTFTVKYPEDFTSKGLAGKEIEYTATITAVRRRELPELDDEWVKSLDEEGIDSLETLRARVRENLSEQSQHESEQEVRGGVMGKLIAAHQFEVPDVLVEQQSNRMVESMVRDMMRRGMDPRKQELNWDSLRDMVRERAVNDLRGSLLLERIADAEGIEVADEEIEAEVSSIAEGTRQTVEQVRAALTKQGGERSIADRLRHRKALDLLVENATVTEAEWSDEPEPEEASEDALPASPEATTASASEHGSEDHQATAATAQTSDGETSQS